MVAAEAIMIISQKLSWASGQMYFLLRSRTRMMVSLAMALEGVEEGESWRYGYMGMWEEGVPWLVEVCYFNCDSFERSRVWGGLRGVV